MGPTGPEIAPGLALTEIGNCRSHGFDLFHGFKLNVGYQAPNISLVFTFSRSHICCTVFKVAL